MAQISINPSGWTQLGPGNIGGRTRSLAVHPQNPAIMYAGSVTGGVWKTTNGGQSWSPTMDGLPLLNIGSLAMDPVDPNTLYAGTGELYAGWPGQGIFKTTDGGATWTLLGQQFPYVNKIVISPNNRLRLYITTRSGVWTSGDGAQTWKEILAQGYEGCQDLVIRNDQKTDYLFASCTGAQASSDYAVWRNTDAAGTGKWQTVQTSTGMGPTALAIAPSQPSTIYALASVNAGTVSKQDRMLAVYRSTSNGDAGSWAVQVSNSDPDITNTLLISNVRNALGSFCTGGPLGTYGGGWSIALAVDPKDPNRVWAAGVDVFRSDDGGATWGLADLFQLDPSPTGNHADHHDFIFHPNYDGASNQSMYLLTDGGIFRTDNARAAVSTGPQGGCESVFLKANQVRWTSLNKSYVATQYYFGAGYQGGRAYMAGSQDTSLNRGTDVGGINNWTSFGDADAGVVVIDPADANHVFTEFENSSGGALLATDGATFVHTTNGITEPESGMPFLSYVAADPHEGKHLFYGGGVNLWRSVDGGQNWTAAAPVESGSSVSAIAVSPFDSNVVLFGTRLGFIYRNNSALTSTGTAVWPSAQPRNGNVSSIRFDRTNPNLIYATYSTDKSIASDAHIYKSTDGGVTWQASDGSGANSVPDIPVLSLVQNPYNQSQLYIGTDLGILDSTDGGATWGKDPNGFPNVIVEDLEIEGGPNPRWLFAFTLGRGAWKIPLPGGPSGNCTYSVSPTAIALNPLGGFTPVTVSAPAGCPWVALPGSQPAAVFVQSPAQGVGSGTVYLWASPNSSGAPFSDILTIADTLVQVTQAAAAPSAKGSDSQSSAPTLTLPSYAVFDNTSYTSAAADPVHSCTGSADFKSAWWKITPDTSGLLTVRAANLRNNTFGNGGAVLTAYAQSAPSVELGCATAPRDFTAEIDAILTFAVTAGSTYLIEVSVPAAGDAGTVQLIAAMGGPPTVISVSPTSAVAGASQPVQFTAAVFGAQNTAVRWSLAPSLGSISPDGLYTPPASLSAPATVTVTATPFADPSKSASATIALTAAAGSQPILSLVLNAAGEEVGISQNAWIELKGANLAPDTRIWQGQDFVNGEMPQSLDGVRVTVNGKSAYVYYISPTQVNVLTPPDTTSGPVQVQLQNNAGTSNTFTSTLGAASPGFFVFDAGNHVAATHADGSYIGPAALYPGTTTPAKPGETVILYGNGFGPVVPPVTAGAAAQTGTLATLPMITIGGYPAVVQFAGLVAPGEFQFNVVVPAGVPSGDNVLTATYNGAISQPGVLLAIQ